MGVDLETRRDIFRTVAAESGTPFAIFQDDPVGFVQIALGEVFWSKQREIATSVVSNKRTTVAAGHAPGKSHTAARMVAWWCGTHSPGTAMAVTTAPTFRQVRNVLWPHLRRLVARHGLPGATNQVEWKIGDELVAYGFSAGDHDEAAMQGIHAPHLAIIVDEAGGISHTLGRSFEALMTGDHTRLLAIGNPPTDQEDSWFERTTLSPLYNFIKISAYDTPNFTGEDAGMCHSCPPGVADHPVATHLVDVAWVHEVIEEFGEDSAFVIARVLADFPRSVANKVIPFSWIEQSLTNEEPVTRNHVCLGVDVAADGGDEFAICRLLDGQITNEHQSSGQANANVVDVAQVVLQHIHAAQAIHDARNWPHQVRVKVDAIGVGWGVAGLLETWFADGRHRAKIVAVNVAERARQADKYANQRAEMWWTMRLALAPTPSTEPGVDPRQDLALRVDKRTQSQLTAPLYRSDGQGRIVIERKADLKRRGMVSPDRAEAALLALYEPPLGNETLAVAPLSVGKSADYWRDSGT